MKTLDACGISCPEPLLMLKNELATEKELLLLVDSKNALDNCRDYAASQGFSVNVTADAGKYALHISAAQ
jgi:TusA-related sulfurtransferase